MSELETGFRISDVVAMITRRLPIVVGAAVVGLIAGYLVFAGAPESYSATARVQVKAIKLNPFVPDGKDNTPDIATEKDLVKSDAVARAVAKALSLPGDSRAVLSRIAVATELDSNVLKITFTGDTAQQAKDGADAAAAGYLAQRQSTASKSRDDIVKQLNADVADASAAVSDASKAVDGTKPGTAERTQAQQALQSAQAKLNGLNDQVDQLNQFVPASVGALTREASLPPATTSKKALGKGVGVFGLFTLGGLAAAWFLDRKDGLGGGRRRVEQLLPSANMRVLPGAEGTSASPAEVDAAIDRLAVEMVAGGAPGKAASVLVVGAGMEPPVAMAEELASSLAFAGIPALFVLAGSTDRELRQAHTVASFADLVTNSASISGPAGLPATAGEAMTPGGPLVRWLRPKGSPEAAGLLRRGVVDSLIARASRERFEAVVFVASSPTRAAAGAALGQWVGRTALIVGPDDRPQAEAAATALVEADVRVTEVVWT